VILKTKEAFLQNDHGGDLVDRYTIWIDSRPADLGRWMQIGRSAASGRRRTADGSSARRRSSSELTRNELPALCFDGTNTKLKLRRRGTHLGSWDGEWSGGEGDRAAKLRRWAALWSRAAASVSRGRGGGAGRGGLKGALYRAEEEGGWRGEAVARSVGARPLMAMVEARVGAVSVRGEVEAA
jgi:hypothetical protein